MKIERVVYNDDKSDMMYLYKLNKKERELAQNRTEYVVTDHKIETVLDYENALIYLKNNNNLLHIDDDSKGFAAICMQMQLEINDLVSRISNLQEQFIQISSPQRNLYELFTKMANEDPEVLSKYTGIPNNIKPYDIS